MWFEKDALVRFLLTVFYFFALLYIIWNFEFRIKLPIVNPFDESIGEWFGTDGSELGDGEVIIWDPATQSIRGSMADADVIADDVAVLVQVYSNGRRKQGVPYCHGSVVNVDDTSNKMHLLTCQHCVGNMALKTIAECIPFMAMQEDYSLLYQVACVLVICGAAYFLISSDTVVYSISFAVFIAIVVIAVAAARIVIPDMLMANAESSCKEEIGAYVCACPLGQMNLEQFNNDASYACREYCVTNKMAPTCELLSKSAATDQAFLECSKWEDAKPVELEFCPIEDDAVYIEAAFLSVPSSFYYYNSTREIGVATIKSNSDTHGKSEIGRVFDLFKHAIKTVSTEWFEGNCEIYYDAPTYKGISGSKVAAQGSGKHLAVHHGPSQVVQDGKKVTFNGAYKVSTSFVVDQMVALTNNTINIGCRCDEGGWYHYTSYLFGVAVLLGVGFLTFTCFK